MLPAPRLAIGGLEDEGVDRYPVTLAAGAIVSHTLREATMRIFVSP